jgi:NAD-reducing hydrogenase small subunit
MKKLRLATLWLDGCSGCHMSLLDTDQRLLDLLDLYEVVYSPLMDSKTFPKQVDVVCIEGAVGTVEDARMLRLVRRNSATLIAMGDCAVTGNIPALRNSSGAGEMLHRVYGSEDREDPPFPSSDLPTVLDKALPLHHYVDVDHFLPGCPPSAETLLAALVAVARNEQPHLNSRFGD